MKKWVIKQYAEGAPLELWEYIDSVEEAMKYVYVAQAIRKYGVDQVVPLAMNKLGGYHHLPRDSKEIVQIIESDEAPTLSVYRQYPVNATTIQNGWMHPNGTTFECGSYGHISCALQLCNEFHVPEAGTIHDDEALLEHGWIKIFNGEWYGRWKKINDNQIRILETLGITPMNGGEMRYSE
ncbi:MAG: hypothetical protein PHX61_08135 [Alphaproteobacteria bacterium]|nr:hypothetical protein [Alphaproteobacteria bacterium]